MSGDSATRAILAIVGSILALATLSAVLSPKANTVAVVNASTSGLAGLINAATAPITGGGGGGFSGTSSGGLGAFNSFIQAFGGGSFP